MYTNVLLIFMLLSSIRATLYINSPSVKILAANNFSSELTTKDPFTVHIVEFYSSSCGHCINFEPSWINIANTMLNWKPYVSLAAINCNDKENFEICKKQLINAIGYPTFKIFTNPKDVFEGNELDINRVSNDQFKSLIMHQLSLSRKLLKWYSMLDYRSATFLDDEIYNPHYSAVIVIVEQHSSLHGRILIMDFLPIKDTVPALRIAPDINEQFHLGSNENIAVYVYHNNDIHKIMKKILVRSRPRMVTTSTGWNYAIEDKLTELGINIDLLHKQDSYVNLPTTTTEVKLSFDKERFKVYLADIEAGISYMFQTEIPLKSVISGDRLTFLREWIKIILKYIPVRPHIQNSLISIHELISTKDSVDGITIRNEALNGTPEKFMKEEYFHCKGSKPHFRGYPCSVWLLFHTLTVKYAESSINLSKDIDLQGAHYIFNSMRNYLDYFFTCRECAKHFVDHSDHVKAQILDGDSLILAIWEAHNKANIALQGALTDDPEMPKSQFPQHQLCSSCVHDNEWSKQEVLKFLKKYYNPNTSIVHSFNTSVNTSAMILSPWLEMQQRQSKLQQKASSHNQNAILNLPLAIRIFFIVSSIILLASTLILSFIKIRKHRNVLAHKIV